MTDTGKQERIALYMQIHPYEDESRAEQKIKQLRTHAGTTVLGIFNTMESLLSICAGGNADTVWMESLTDLSDDIGKAMQMLDILCQMGTRVRTKKEGFDSSRYDVRKMKETIHLLNTALCEDEPSKLTGKSDPRDREWIAGIPLYGYYRVGASVWEPDPRQAEKVVTMFQMACCGFSYTRMLEKVLEMEKACPTGKLWNTDVLNLMFKQEMYAGDHIRVKCKKGRKSDGSTYYYRSRSDDDRQILRNHHTPLVSHEVLDVVGELLKARLFYSVRKLYTDKQVMLLEQAWQAAVKEWGLETMERIQGV